MFEYRNILEHVLAMLFKLDKMNNFMLMTNSDTECAECTTPAAVSQAKKNKQK